MTPTSGSPASRERRPVPPGWAWALVAGFAVHNLEEAWTMDDFLASGAGRLPERIGVDASVLGPFVVAVTVLTLGAVVLAVLASTRRPPRWIRPALRLLAMIMVVNVVVPHVPAAVVTGGYVPGVVTAVLVNVPLGLAFLRRTRPTA